MSFIYKPQFASSKHNFRWGSEHIIGHQLLGVCVRESERSISFSMRAMGVKALGTWAMLM